MNAKKLAEEYNKENEKQHSEFQKSLARLFLGLPVPMSYELWRYFHEVIGDW